MCPHAASPAAKENRGPIYWHPMRGGIVPLCPRCQSLSAYLSGDESELLALELALQLREGEWGAPATRCQTGIQLLLMPLLHKVGKRGLVGGVLGRGEAESHEQRPGTHTHLQSSPKLRSDGCGVLFQRTLRP